MLFDLDAALAEILNDTPSVAAPAASAANRPLAASAAGAAAAASQIHRRAGGVDGGRNRLPDARPEPDKSPFCPVLSGCRVEKSPSEITAQPDPLPASAPAPSRQDAEPFPYGTAQGDRPRTWTGRVVSLDEWRRLSDWERHGSTGQHFNALSGRWEGGDAQ